MTSFRTITANAESRQCDQVDQGRNDEQIKECFGISLLQRHAQLVGHNKSDAVPRETLMAPDVAVEVEDAALVRRMESINNGSKQATEVTDYTRLYKNERLAAYSPATAWRWSGWISEPLREFCRVQLNPDENLVVYHAKNGVFTPLWDTGPGMAGEECTLSPQTCSLECVYVVRYISYGRWVEKVWHTFHSTRVGPCANPILVMQTDCNLVLYSGEGLPAVWATHTNGFVSRMR